MWLGTEYFGPLKHRELWRRWRAGEAFSEIGRALGCSRAMVHYTVMARGGFPPHPRLRREGTLELIEREEISRGLAQRCSLRQIARTLGRAPSTISREIARNGGQRRYRAFYAYMSALKRALRPKQCLLARHERLRQVVSERLQQRWSPEQISGWLVRQFANDESMRVSPETIYRSLFIQPAGYSSNGCAITSVAVPACAVLEQPWRAVSPHRGRSWVRSVSISVLQRWRIELSPDIGRGIC